jgi:hypothetical protein
MTTKWFDLSIGDENRVSKPLIVTEENLHGVDYYDLKLGKRLESWKSESSIKSESTKHDGIPDDFLAESLGVPILSHRLRSALERADVGIEDIQYLPIRVFQSTGDEVHGFAIANVISRVRALDYEQSTMLDLDEHKIDPLTGQREVLSVWKAALKGNALDGYDVIRLTEFFPAIFVSRRFVDVVREGNFTGATFIQVLVT